MNGSGARSSKPPVAAPQQNQEGVPQVKEIYGASKEDVDPDYLTIWLHAVAPGFSRSETPTTSE